MFKDRMLLAGVGGFVGTLADGMIHWAALLAGLTRSTTGHYLASIIFAVRDLHAGQILLGELAHLIAGSALGASILLALKWSGRGHYQLKGAVIGAVFWLNHVIVVPSLAAARIQIKRSAAEVLVDLIALAAWGMVTAFIIERNEASSR